MKKFLNIITFASLGIILITSLYGYSLNPIDPPSKPGENTKVIALPSPYQTDECSDMLSLVPITVIVTFTDCPDYFCCYPNNCSFNICIYDDSYTQLGCKPWDPEVCQYTFTGIRAEEQTYIYAHLVLLTSCICEYNEGYPQSSNTVPPGGGTVYINTTYCP